MSVSWTNEKELTFIDHFHAEPVLWDVKLKNHKNKFKIYDAWMRISSIMNIPVDELKKKKDSMMSSYRSYKSKVNKSITSGASADDVYTPIWFAYEEMDAFLGDIVKCKTTINTDTQSANFNEDVEIEHVEQGQEDQQNVNIQDKENQQNVKTQRRRRNPPELTEAGNIVKDAISTLKTMTKHDSQVVQSQQQDDDCDLYGKLLAKKLRDLPKEQRLRLMHRIDGMFLETLSSFESFSPPPPTPFHPIISNNNNYYTNKRSRTSYSDMSPQRFGTSLSNYSEPPMHYTPIIITKPANHGRNIGPNVTVTSNTQIEPPVIHIPDQSKYATNTDSNNVIHIPEQSLQATNTASNKFTTYSILPSNNETYYLDTNIDNNQNSNNNSNAIEKAYLNA